MLSSGFTDVPVTRNILYGLVSSSLLASILDAKYYFYILVDTHLWQYHQLWRVLISQLCYTNSSEVLFGAIMIYQLRVIERIWGSRKFASFILVTYLLTSIIPPLLLVLIIRPLSLGKINYLPAGPTALFFAVLAQFHAVIPHVYKYRLATSPASETPARGPVFSDKSYTYLLALQLSLSQFPGSLLQASVGWMVGYIWRNDLLPSRISTWRVPGWTVGMKSTKKGGEFDGLRRRLEGEATAGTTSSETSEGGADGRRRRTLGGQLVDQFRGNTD